LKRPRFILITLCVFVLMLLLPACTSPATPSPAQPTEPAALAPTVVPVTLDGKQLLEQRCIECHDLQRTESAKKSAEGWGKTVQRMMDKGAILTADEKSTLVEYLAKAYPQ